MKERKTNLTSCWMDRSKMNAVSKDAAIDSALLCNCQADWLPYSFAVKPLTSSKSLLHIEKGIMVRLQALTASLHSSTRGIHWTRGGQRQCCHGLLLAQASLAQYSCAARFHGCVLSPKASSPTILRKFLHSPVLFQLEPFLARAVQGRVRFFVIPQTSNLGYPKRFAFCSSAPVIRTLQTSFTLGHTYQTNAMAVAAIAQSAAQVAVTRQSVVARKSFSGVAGLKFAVHFRNTNFRMHYCTLKGLLCRDQLDNSGLGAQL